MTESIRLYQQGRLSNIPAPGWLERAIDLSCNERLGWQASVTRAIGVEHQGLTAEAIGPIGLDVSFWRSPTHGIYVELDSHLDLIEQVLIPDPADWLPFISVYLMPLMSAVVQMETAGQLERLTNTALSWVRHGGGQHVDRSSGLSQIDRQRDRETIARLREHR
jgi:hypothetical protein